MRRRPLAAGAAVLLLVLTGTLGPVGLTRPAAAADGSAVLVVKAMDRLVKGLDGADKQIDARTVTVKVDQTQDLQGRQNIDVSWSGAHPTGGYVAAINTPNAVDQEYPVAILQCRGVDTPTTSLDPTTCWSHGLQSRYQSYGDGADAPWMLDRYATAADRSPTAGRPTPEPAGCVANNSDVERWVPFIGVDGTTFNYGNTFSCGNLPPEDYNVENPANTTPSNATFAATGLDGTGDVKFSVWTDQENASLGCSATVKCSIVVIPIMGISCDSSALAAGPEASFDADNCATTGKNQPGAPATSSNLHAQAVSGDLWWSASNWRNRISVPVTFRPAANVCNANTSDSEDIYGSELMVNATNQWAPKFCLDPSLFKFNHVQTGEPVAKNLLASGNISAAFSSAARPGGYPVPVVQAPVAMTGFAISFNIDDAKGKPVTSLKLTPRLIAKLLTESYPTIPEISSDYPQLAGNPQNVTMDPEFQTLNPGIPQRAAISSMGAMLILAGNSDVTSALTAYINADPEARAWLDGKPDPWGMHVNPLYKGISLPVDIWPLLDTYVRTNQNDLCLNVETPFLPAVASPAQTLAVTAQSVQFAISNSKTNCTQTGDINGGLSQLVAAGRQTIGFRFVIAVTTLSDVTRYGLDAAALESQSSADPNAQYSSAAGRTFVAPSTASLLAAAKLLVPNSDTGNWPIPYDRLRTAAGGTNAYAGAMMVYADVPTTGLPSADAAKYAQLIRFAIGAGQTPGLDNGDIPPGYLPMTAANGFGAQIDYANRAAAAVAAQKGDNPGLTSTVPAPDPVPVDSSLVYTSGNSAGTGSGTSPADDSGPASSAPGASSGPSASSTPASKPAAKPSARAVTQAAHSTLGGAVLPAILALALLGTLAIGGLFYAPRKAP